MGQVVTGVSKRPASADTVVAHAEHVYSVAEGAAPPAGIEELSTSWQRSANKYGVDPVDRKAPRILTPGELKDFRDARIDGVVGVALLQRRPSFSGPSTFRARSKLVTGKSQIHIMH
jgi:hypothetical protein